MLCNVLDYLEGSAQRQPEKYAVTDGTSCYTYEQLRLCSARIGTALSSPFYSVLCMRGASTPC